MFFVHVDAYHIIFFVTLAKFYGCFLCTSPNVFWRWKWCLYSKHRPNNPSYYRLPVFNPDAKKIGTVSNSITKWLLLMLLLFKMQLQIIQEEHSKTISRNEWIVDMLMNDYWYTIFQIVELKFHCCDLKHVFLNDTLQGYRSIWHFNSW